MPRDETDPPEDPRTRAARTKRERTRRALIESADALFGTRGWNQTRVEDVAAAAGVSPATAYNHFPTKHSLIGTVYAPLLRPLLLSAEADRAAGRSVVDALSDQVRALSRTSARHRTLTAALTLAMLDYTARTSAPPLPGDESDPRNLAPMTSTIQGLIEDGQRSGELRSFPPAVEISGMVVNLLMIRSLNRPHETADQTAEMLLTVMFGAVKPEFLMSDRVDGRPFSGDD
ncbi:MAG: TetR/AcrR family transcriptional regulator [Pseudonocardia sp.]|nr:TetR/AcrR family transcriptional regulator [Pseudonocardia sp.]